MRSPVTHEAGPFTEVHGVRLYMAKYVTGAADDETVVYRNGDPYDHRRENLLVLSTAEFYEAIERDHQCEPPSFRPRFPRYRRRNR